VTETDDGRYIVLDGATRTAAIEKLGFKHGIVQVISTDDGLGLRTWYHVIQKISVEKLIQLLNELPDVSLVESELEGAADTMFEYGGLCYVHTVDGRVFLVYAAPGVNRLEALNQLTETYIEASHVARTLDDNIISLKNEYEDMAAGHAFQWPFIPRRHYPFSNSWTHPAPKC